MKRFFFFSFLLLAVIGQKDVIACNKSLAHTRFVCFGVRQVTLDFINGNTCIVTQSIQMALPSGPEIRRDTLRYHINDSIHISFTNCNRKAPSHVKEELFPDYSALCFYSAEYISRSGKPLADYRLIKEPDYLHYKLTEAADGSFYVIPKEVKGFYLKDEHCMVLRFEERKGFGLFYQVPDKKNATWTFQTAAKLYDPMKELWDFCWFSRTRFTPSSPILSEVADHQFAYLHDTLMFMGDSICMEYRQALDSTLTRTYSIDGAYIILNHPKPTKQAPDTLLYKDGIIYNAIVCQTKDSVELFKGIGPSYNSPKPTGTMTVIAYEDINKELVPDSVIGYAFQHYYMPINYRRE